MRESEKILSLRETTTSNNTTTNAEFTAEHSCQTSSSTPVSEVLHFVSYLAPKFLRSVKQFIYLYYKAPLHFLPGKQCYLIAQALHNSLSEKPRASCNK